jgi:hypothetical protein
MSLAAAVIQNIEMFSGDMPTIAFGPVLDQLGSPVSLSGAMLTMTVWAGQNAYAPALFSLSSAGGGITVPTQTGSATGTFTVTIPSAATQNVLSGFAFAGNSGQLYYQIELTLAGVTACVIFGFLTLSP